MNLYEALKTIQEKLKVSKGQNNDFGKYKYRSNEDILESVKPIAHSCGCFVVQSDDLVLIGDRHYVKATTYLYPISNSDSDSIAHFSSTAYAREELNKKGMDASQITGSASSYARKYSACGLFAIDSTKDADTRPLKTAQDFVNEIIKDIIDVEGWKQASSKLRASNPYGKEAVKIFNEQYQIFKNQEDELNQSR